ncbi:hypothetical protein [Actinomadura roseirufa]|uniref:hypothetical protein n=1 Tax=Actinomadura roseirufa TaxID=2094049 RepID=UPI0010414BE3|nr:hypothetical protein [Actinomadura roseirufa]
MLADTGMVGDPYLWVIGPIVIFIALAGWLALTLHASRKRERPVGKDPGLPHRGAVTGGIIQGSPSQRTRRDAAPTPAEREAARRLAREREAAEREAAERRAAERRAAQARSERREPWWRLRRRAHRAHRAR